MSETRIEAAIREILVALGEDPDRDGLRDTPSRVARSLTELTAGLHIDPADHLHKVFEVDSDALVVVQDITFHTLCEHHLLPFFGRVHVGYLPAAGRVTGLSKLARCVDGYARRLQVQERLTNQIATAMNEALEPRGVAVMIEAEHLCMTMRGVRKPGALTTTTFFSGDLDTPSARADFLAQVRPR